MQCISKWWSCIYRAVLIDSCCALALGLCAEGTQSPAHAWLACTCSNAFMAVLISAAEGNYTQVVGMPQPAKQDQPIGCWAW